MYELPIIINHSSIINGVSSWLPKHKYSQRVTRNEFTLSLGVYPEPKGREGQYACPVALHLSRALYKSTLFMQNKANLPDAQMNVTSSITKHYENDNTFRLPENKPNSKPIQSQYKPNSRKAKMNVGSVITKDYENKRPCRRPENKANSNPNKPNCKRKSLLIQSDFCEIIEVVRRKMCFLSV